MKRLLLAAGLTASAALLTGAAFQRPPEPVSVGASALSLRVHTGALVGDYGDRAALEALLRLEGDLRERNRQFRRALKASPPQAEVWLEEERAITNFSQITRWGLDLEEPLPRSMGTVLRGQLLRGWWLAEQGDALAGLEAMLSTTRFFNAFEAQATKPASIRWAVESEIEVWQQAWELVRRHNDPPLRAALAAALQKTDDASRERVLADACLQRERSARQLADRRAGWFWDRPSLEHLWEWLMTDSRAEVERVQRECQLARAMFSLPVHRRELSEEGWDLTDHLQHKLYLHEFPGRQNHPEQLWRGRWNAGTYWLRDYRIWDQREAARAGLTVALAVAAWADERGASEPGDWPPALSQLTPEQLAEAPVDPFTGEIPGYNALTGQVLCPWGNEGGFIEWAPPEAP
jgi:hypothetical protein